MNPAHRSLELIHYGSAAYDPAKFRPVNDSQWWIKPTCCGTNDLGPYRANAGLWASPVASGWGWKEWCLSEDFNTERLAQSFRLQAVGNCLTLDTEADLALLQWIEDPAIPPNLRRFTTGIAFAQMRDVGIDMIWLTERGQHETRFSAPRSLYGWDCESVLIMNPAIIKPYVMMPAEFAKPANPAPPAKRRRSIRLHD